MAQFITRLNIISLTDKIWKLDDCLIYLSDIIGRIIVPLGFETDLASVPRLPIFYALWGGKAHYEAVIHDYLYRKDCDPIVSFKVANKVFLEAMKVRKKKSIIRYPMFWGVMLGGKSSYHKRLVNDSL